MTPAGTARCDCGWDFAAARLSPGAALAQERTAAIRARASWLCPVIAWGSQFAIAMILRDARAPGWFWMLITAAQGVLLMIGFYCGAKVLALGPAALPRQTWRAALAGVAISAGTIVLIVGLSVAGGG